MWLVLSDFSDYLDRYSKNYNLSYSPSLVFCARSFQAKYSQHFSYVTYKLDEVFSFQDPQTILRFPSLPGSDLPYSPVRLGTLYDRYGLVFGKPDL